MTKREQDKHSKMLIERAALQLRREEEERQRHKEMFAKKPTSSFQNVAKLGMTSTDSGDKAGQGKQQEQEASNLPPRTKSALSLLLNPDPSIFPENHPYRRGYSSGELVRPGPSHMMGLVGMGGFGPLTTMNAGVAPQQRPQMHPIQMGVDAQRRPAALDRQMSEQFLARDAAEAEQKRQQAALEEQERVRKLMAEKEKLEEEERAKRARIQQVEQEERAQQKQLQQALQERAQRQQQQQRHPQRRVTDPAPPIGTATQPPQEQQRAQHRRQASQVSQQPKASRPPSVHGGMGSIMPMAFRGAGMQANKSSAAMPVASQVDIGPIAAFDRPPQQGPAGSASTSSSAAPQGGAGYRPRGPPQGQELDTDSEDEAEGKENANALNMAKSIAEQKLRMFAEKRGIVPAPLGPVPAAAPPSPLRPHGGPSAQRPHPQVLETTPPWARQPHQDQRHEDHRSHGGPRVPPQPIPLMHPYNLPVAAIPTTPKTTRRMMLRTEMSESVRRGLLTERQQGVRPIKRTTSASNAEGLGRFPAIPQLAASPSMVQLRPKVRRLDGQEEGVVTAPPVKKATPEELEERKKRALARNRSDANNFHTSGW